MEGDSQAIATMTRPASSRLAFLPMALSNFSAAMAAPGADAM